MDKEEPKELPNVDVRRLVVLAGSIVRIKDGNDIFEVKINNNIQVYPAKNAIITGNRI